MATCACGCETEFVPTTYYNNRLKIIPRYLRGHNNKTKEGKERFEMRKKTPQAIANKLANSLRGNNHPLRNNPIAILNHSKGIQTKEWIEAHSGGNNVMNRPDIRAKQLVNVPRSEKHYMQTNKFGRENNIKAVQEALQRPEVKAKHKEACNSQTFIESHSGENHYFRKDPVARANWKKLIHSPEHRANAL
jgi:hypothetical protein